MYSNLYFFKRLDKLILSLGAVEHVRLDWSQAAARLCGEPIGDSLCSQAEKTARSQCSD